MDTNNCNNNDSSFALDAIENSNNDENNNSVKMLDCIKSEKYQMSELDEFDQVLSEYREQKHTIIQKLTNTTNEYSATQTILNLCLDIAETAENTIGSKKTTENAINFEEIIVNVTNSEATPEKLNSNEDGDPLKMTLNENCTINKVGNEFIEVFQIVKTDSDVISISSDEPINLDNSDDILDLDTISLFSYNSIVFQKTNENKSIEIEVDLNNALNEVNNKALESDLGIATENDLDVKFNGSNIAIDNDVKMATKSYDDDSESNSSFHSSDFEFITEDEAKLDGVIVNFRKNDIQGVKHNVKNENFDETFFPGPSYDRENHRIPEGEEFFNLFHGFFAPANVPELMFLENKSVAPSKCMSVDDEVVGFFEPALQDMVDEKYQEEANETAKKIQESYHEERRRSRRHL